MANLAKSKEKARQYELKEQWAKAIDEYAKAIKAMEAAPEADADLSIYNRVGDLYQRIGNTQSAVTYYERALEKYVEVGFSNNAIALCNKVLRLAPGRVHVYLKLGMLLASKGFTSEAKANLLEYADRMQKAGQLEEAFSALKKFAEMTPGQDEIWAVLAEQARASAKTRDQKEQVEKLLAEFEARDRVAHRRKPRPSRHQITGEELPAEEPGPKKGELIFLDLEPAPRRVSGAQPAVEPPPEPPKAAPLEIEPTALVSDEEASALPPIEIERTSLAGDEATPEPPPLVIEPTSLAEVEALPAVEPESEPEAESGVGGLPFIEVEAPEGSGAAAEGEAAAPAAPSIQDLHARIARDAEDWEAHRLLAEALLERGERERAFAELTVVMEGLDRGGELEAAYGIAEEMVRLEPNSVRYHQKLVELAYREGNRARLTDAYLELADALLRTGEAERAVAVYQRVLEHDPGNARARSAVESLVPAPAPPPPGPAPVAAAPAAPAEGFVDLGALLLEGEGAKDTRMRIEDEEPSGDEEKDFQAMLSAFKRGVEANVEEEDFQSHYDLGVAYKEMGLLDEAIAEFQKALRSSEGRLRASEALGLCFFEKGQFTVAETILRRGLDLPAQGDAERVGLLYWLGRAQEELGHRSDALTAYNRVFAVDITFQDVSQRVRSLSRAGA
jgi:tetratricopeptide (TPR) repeat protein